MPRGVAKFMDYSTYEGATELATRLDAYWHKHGHTGVRHQVEQLYYAANEHARVWTVTTNLVGGLPPGVRSGRELRFTWRRPYQQ